MSASGPVSITRRVEFDAGHRIPNHASKCRHLHGHRYVVLAEVSGPVKPDNAGEPDDGMVLDFGVLRSTLDRLVVEPWDHRMLLWEHDPVYADIGAHPGVIAVPWVPTAENIARAIGDALRWEFEVDRAAGPDVNVVSVVVFETPNCSARWP